MNPLPDHRRRPQRLRRRPARARRARRRSRTRSRAIRRSRRASPSCARQNAALRDAFDPWLAEPMPERLLAAAAGRRAGAPRRWPRWLAPALAAAATLVLGAGRRLVRPRRAIERDGTPTTFARQAAFAHALYAGDANRPVEIWAAEEKRLVHLAVAAPGLRRCTRPTSTALGFALVGGRLVAGNEKPTALFMYENADKQRLTLQVRKQAAPAATRPRSATRSRTASASSTGSTTTARYALSGNLDRTQLLAIARVVYGQLAALEARRRASS